MTIKQKVADGKEKVMEGDQPSLRATGRGDPQSTIAMLDLGILETQLIVKQIDADTIPQFPIQKLPEVNVLFQTGCSSHISCLAAHMLRVKDQAESVRVARCRGIYHYGKI